MLLGWELANISSEFNIFTSNMEKRQRITSKDCWKHVLSRVERRRTKGKERQKDIVILSNCNRAANIHCRKVSRE